MKMAKWLTFCLLILGLSVGIISCTPNADQRIVIGSKNFTEQRILGELLAQYLEANTDLKVERRLDLGGTFVCHNAITAGQIDTYVEYTGTAFTAILKRDPINNPQEVYKQVQQEYNDKLKIKWMPPLGFNNTYAIIIRGEDARKFNIKTVSEVAKYTPNWRVGFGYEFTERKDGLTGLSKTYSLRFSQAPLSMDPGLIYRAIKNKQVDLIAGNSTDGIIDALDLVILKDDRQYFPPYEAAPIVRQETLEKHPELEPLFKRLAGIISESEMRKLTYEVDGKSSDVKQVVRNFLQSKSLIKKG